LILYESPHRLAACLRDLRDVLGGDRQAAICRELTKKFEEITRASLDDLTASFAEREVKGEIVIVVDRAAECEVREEDIREVLVELLERHSVKEAAGMVAERFEMSKRDAYQLALKMQEQE
jgi:16S rRNA (cytidine1402-2'-O)-methyltransferase